TRPQTVVQTNLPPTSNLPTADFTLTSPNEVNPVTFECRLDRPGQVGAFAPCTTPVSYTGLTTNGTYTFRARATDAAGNLDTTEATFTWMVDTNLPDTAI